MSRVQLRAALIVAVAAVLCVRHAEAPQPSPLEQLLRIRLPARTIEARINGARWTPFRPGNAAGPAPAAQLELEGKAGELLRESEHSRSGEVLHAAGVASLLLGRTDDAIGQLGRATRLLPGNAAIWSDLAAAQLAFSAARNEPQRLPGALAAADRALRIAPESSAARFNRALTLTRLGLRNEARQAWRITLQNEPDATWAAEGRWNLDALAAAEMVPVATELERALAGGSLQGVVSRRIEEVRTFTESVLVTAWADAFVAGDAPEAARLLTNLRRIADAVVAANGDRYLHDVVWRIEAGTARAELASAHVGYRTARLHYRDQKEGSDAELLRVAALFRDLDSPMEYVTEYYAANAAFERNRPEETRRILERLLLQIEGRRYPSLVAGAQKLLGMYYAFRGMWTKALLHLERARDLFAAQDERMIAAFTEAIVGEVYDRIGQFQRGWRHRTTALDGLSRSAPDQRSVAVLVGAVHAEIMRGEYESALSLVEIARDQASLVGDPLLASELMVREARAMLIARGAAAAAEVVRRAKETSARIADPLTRQRVVADLAVAQGEIALRSDPRLAAAILTPAIDFYEKNGFGMLLPPAYLERGRAQLAGGDRAAALADLQRGLAEIERQREHVAIDIRTTIFDTVPDLIAETVDLLLTEGRETEAYGVVERARARTLIEALGVPPTAGSEAGLEAIAASLPANGVLIEYALLPRGIAAFCIRPQGMKVVRLPGDRDTLRRRVEELGVAIDARQSIPDVQRLAAVLYSELIAPLEPQLGDAEVLYIAPDRFLYATPFAALFDGKRGEYLIERRRIVIAPSGAFLLRRPRNGLTTKPALIISDPTNEQAAWLPAARREASAIARLYPGSLLLDGADATVERFIGEARRSALIHYAGHGGQDDGAGGFLPLAPLNGADGRLDATSISRLPLRETSLIILSACATMRGSASRVEGMPSVSRAFLTAGAPRVIGMLWEVDDEAAAPLLLSFHTLLPRYRSASAALQAAQRELLRSEHAALRHPASWAAAAVLGAD